MKPMQAAYHQGPASIHGGAVKRHDFTYAELRVRLHLPPLEDVIMRRRMGLLYRVMKPDSPWLLRLMAASASNTRSWTSQAIQGLQQLAAHEPGPPPP